MTSPPTLRASVVASQILVLQKATPMIPHLYCLCLFVLASTPLISQPSHSNSPDLKKQDAIVDAYLRNGAWKFHMYSDEWQQKIDEGLRADSTIAYLWQQKAMPLYKQKRYREGLPFLDNAVRYDRAKYLPYRGFMKCIFSKDYTGAIDDFALCLDELGNGYVMDHSYKFYSAVAHLQLQEFKKAENFLTAEIETVSRTRGEKWVHHLDVLYLGIAQLKLKKFKESIQTFNKTLELYPQFSEAHYYKSIAQKTIADQGYSASMKAAKEYFTLGYTINEDNAIYEKYPYQLSAASFER
jgi:tetratricopeptide (TPR) repeat protein